MKVEHVDQKAKIGRLRDHFLFAGFEIAERRKNGLANDSFNFYIYVLKKTVQTKLQ